MRTRLTLCGVLLLCGLLLYLTLSALQAVAAPTGTTYYVDPAGNNANACTAPGASACKTITGALGKAAASGDTISVAAGTYVEHLTINKSVSINGAGAASTILDAANLGRVLTVTTSVAVALSNLTVKRGLILGSGAGIMNHGYLSLNNVAVMSNTSAYGGGIYNDGALTLTNSFILTNTGVFSGGGLYNVAPAFANATAVLSKTEVSGNTATDGAGIISIIGGLLGSASLTIQGSTFVELNCASGSGGGVYSGGTLAVSNSVIQSNQCGTSGGGIFIAGGVGSVSNSAFFVNYSSARGGAIDNDAGTLSLSGVNLEGNNASSGGGISTRAGTRTSVTGSTLTQDTASNGGAIENRGTMTVTNSTISNDTAFDRGGAIYNTGSLILNGTTIVTNTATAFSSSSGGGIDNLGALNLSNVTLRANQANALGGGIYNEGGATLLLITGTIAANTAGTDGGGVYNAGVFAAGTLTVTQNLAPFGSGGGIYNITGTLEIENGVLSLNAAGASGFSSVGGGAIYNARSGTLLLDAASVLSNTASSGGGIFNASPTATLSSLFVFSNTATNAYGGGVYNYGSGKLSLENSTVMRNMAGYSGAGLDNDGLLTITKSLISRNFTTGFGGGVYNYNNTVWINDSTLSDNVAYSGGGGLHNIYGKAFVLDSTISGNLNIGVRNTGTNATLMMTNTTVSGNKSSGDGGGLWNNWSAYLNNVTLAYNVANGQIGGGGIFMPLTNTAVLTMLNTIVANNAGGYAPDCYGRITSMGYNLLGNNDSCQFIANGVTDQVGTFDHPLNPWLAPLALNGNPNGTLTHGLIVGSLAIDKGSPFGPGNPSACATTDQRGHSRPFGPRCDVGAFEGSVPSAGLIFLPAIMR